VDRATERALTVRLPAELHEALRQRAELEERSMAQLVRLAAKLYVDPTAQPPQGPVALQRGAAD
jgi:predicted HicB family RNase H-like nuclease